MEFLSKNERDTAALARDVAGELGAGSLIYLNGDLGAGKSVFARELVRALCGDGLMEVPSPTFTLVQIYDGEKCPVYHFDLYRIQDEEEIFELGWEDALNEGITIVEWPSRLGAYKAKPALDITITNVENEQTHRKIEIAGYGKDTE